MPCGHRATSPAVVAVHLLKSFGNTLNSSRHQTNGASDLALSIPSLKGGAFRANPGKSHHGGYFDSLDDAIEKVKTLKAELHQFNPKQRDI